MLRQSENDLGKMFCLNIDKLTNIEVSIESRDQPLTSVSTCGVEQDVTSEDKYKLEQVWLMDSVAPWCQWLEYRQPWLRLTTESVDLTINRRVFNASTSLVKPCRYLDNEFDLFLLPGNSTSTVSSVVVCVERLP